MYCTSEDGVKLLGVNCNAASFNKACMTACFSNCRINFSLGGVDVLRHCYNTFTYHREQGDMV